jgi:hypothetical protein
MLKAYFKLNLKAKEDVAKGGRYDAKYYSIL